MNDTAKATGSPSGRRHGRQRGYHAAAVKSASRPPKKSALLALATAAFVSLAVPSLASAIGLEPKSAGSPNSDAITDLYRIVAILGIIVLLLVEGALIAAVLKPNKDRGSASAAPREGDRTQSIWTGVATLFVVILAAATFIQLPTITDPPNGLAPGVLASTTSIPSPPDGRKLTINVTGRRFIWRYTYGETVASPFTYTEMVVPSDTVVVLRIQSTDVIHSWWIPSLGGKFDAVPGSDNYTWFKAPAPKNPEGDVYSGQCAEFCGSQHAAMTATVRVVTPANFKVWLADQKAKLAESNSNAVKLRNQLMNEGQIPKDLSPPSN